LVPLAVSVRPLPGPSRRSSTVQVDGDQMATRLKRNVQRERDQTNLTTGFEGHAFICSGIAFIPGSRSKPLKTRAMTPPDRSYSDGSPIGRVRFVRAWLAAFVLLAAVLVAPSAHAQANFDRPGGDYQSAPVNSGDPADCALVCEHDRKCRAWSFSYPTVSGGGAVCWLKNNVPARTQDNCCVSGVRGAGVVEPHNGPIENSIDRFGGDYRNFEVKSEGGDDACKAACAADNKCRAWTYARPAYVGKDAHCFLKKEIKPPRRKPGFISGVVR
jgi:hypothetical protein